MTTSQLFTGLALVAATAFSGIAAAQAAAPDDRVGASAPMTSKGTPKTAPSAARAASAAAATTDRVGASAPMTSRATPKPAKPMQKAAPGAQAASSPTGTKP